MSDPSFLLPAKVEEPKSKAKKVSKVNNEANTEKVSNVHVVSPQTVKKYTQTKLKNDLDTITKKIEKLQIAINKHDETKLEMKKTLQELESKKLELEDLKAQI
jgi:hypothetical protein